MKILIVGNHSGTNVGGSLLHAAGQAGFTAEIVENDLAYGGPKIWRSLCWHLLARSPSSPGRLAAALTAAVNKDVPPLLLTTGISPVRSEELRLVRSRGGVTANFLTDDPWNLPGGIRHFVRTIPDYDIIFSPRRSVFSDLQAAGAKHFVYLPFGYDARFFPGHDSDNAASDGEQTDVLFVGGADADRAPFLHALARAGIAVAAYGSYWNRFPVSGLEDRGQASPGIIAAATRIARLNLILARRSNRDGHVMRSFEAAACGGCLLVEDTQEHREIFGSTVTFFSSPEEMVRSAKDLLHDAGRRQTSAEASRNLIVRDGKHTYLDRLQTIVSEARRVKPR
jgi:hypothetical protein